MRNQARGKNPQKLKIGEALPMRKGLRKMQHLPLNTGRRQRMKKKQEEEELIQKKKKQKQKHRERERFGFFKKN